METNLDRDLPGEVRRFVRERQNSLANASSSTEVIEPLNDIAELFLRGSLQPGKVPLDKRPSLKAEFVNNHFLRFAEFILSSPVIGFYGSFNEDQRKDLFDVFFLRGPSHDSLLVLGDALSKQTANLKNTRVVVSLLEKFCAEGRLVDVFVQQCRISRPLTSGPQKFSQSELESKLWGQLITLIVSLPQRVANKMRLKCSPQFYPEPYFKMVADQILKALEKLHDNLTMSYDCSFKFLGELIGRICMAGQAEKTFAILLPALERWLATSPLWNRICARLITGVPDGTMEHVTEGLLKAANNPSLIAKLFGDSILSNTKLKYLLTSKFLLIRSYSNTNVLYNIIAYLSGCKRRHLLVEDDDDDDDDDLLPYDLDEDGDTSSKSNLPKFLRDCIEGLIASEDPSKTEASLRSVEQLVCAELDDLEDVCVELVKVLLHLEDRYSTDKFYEIRHNAMVSVTIRCPQQIACYLTEECFAPNYNLQQRMDMLNVLADAARQLSAPTEISKTRAVPRKFPLPQADSLKSLQAVPEWQKIVQERIEGKTKRISKGPSCPQPKGVVNKFAGVAGFFFFPLMKNFDVKVNTLDLLGDDTLVLGRLVYTLGIIMYSARDTPVARNMGVALLEFTWALKYHKEPFVRQALIFAQAMVAVSVPSSTLMSDAPGELFELHNWLKTTVESDTDVDSVKAALQTLVLLEEIFKNEVTLHG
ncbi:telomere length regulation protein TEL2 homolog [Orbicella faveolata]|uniref:telomere length regulation protein TEL2 homolog n=1 Tax=Orbicella faveolata TaxID=48498 RepID=UPI0009E25169|nr:telomere length regulation protein TEL2 homolog [Orbicella faveolata]